MVEMILVKQLFIIFLLNIKKNIKEKHIILQLMHQVQQLKIPIVHQQKNRNIILGKQL